MEICQRSDWLTISQGMCSCYSDPEQQAEVVYCVFNSSWDEPLILLGSMGSVLWLFLDLFIWQDSSISVNFEAFLVRLNMLQFW